MEGDTPFLDAATTLNGGAFPVNGASSFSANGTSSNGASDGATLPNAQAISAGSFSNGKYPKTAGNQIPQMRLRCMTDRSDYGE